MSIRSLAGVVSIATLTTTIVVFGVAACGGSSSDKSLFTDAPDAADAAAVTADAGTLDIPDQGNSDAGNASTATCSPSSVAGFTPTWKGPNGASQGLCTSAQMDAFFTACLTPPIDSATCAQFKKANGECSTCLESQESDAKYGPVIWHANKAYYTLNIAGCIANEQNDTTAQGCGAAYQAVLECKEVACTGCFGGNGGSFANFIACETAAGKADCAPFASNLQTVCTDDALHDAAAPESLCLPPAGTTAKDAYRRIAPVFCGAK